MDQTQACEMEVDGAATTTTSIAYEDRVIGSNGCTAFDIAKILADDEQVIEKWLTLAEKLGISPGDKIKCKTDIRNDPCYDFIELFKKLVSVWKAGRGDADGKLSNFLIVLDNLGSPFSGVADKIRQKFGTRPDLR